jgi:hypothetical protein
VAGIIVPQAILTVLVVHRESPTYDEGDHMFAGWVANYKGSLDSGWDYPNIWMAPLRLTVSFVLGLWLYRIHDRVRMPKIGLLLLSIVLVVCFQMPKFPKAGALDWNGL